MKHLRKSSRRRLSRGAIVVAALMLSGCSSTPDWANPLEWYRDAKGWVIGEDANTETARENAAAKEKKGTPGQYPNLSSVPNRPTDVATANQAGRVQEGLVADRAQARHAALGPSDNRSEMMAPPPSASSAPPPVIASPPPPAGRNIATAAPAAAPPAMAPAPPAPYEPSSSASPSGTAVAPAPSMTSGNDTQFSPPADEAVLREAFQAALIQSGGVVNPAQRGGIRDVNRSNVVASSAGNTLPLPPAPRGSVVLRAPPMGGSPAATGAGAGSGAPVGIVLFANNSSKLSGDDNNILKNIMKIKSERGGTLRIVGHASSRTKDLDPLRHRLINFRLSVARADAVARALVSMGVPAKDVTVEARADNEPVYYEFMPAGEAGNRRAEIYLDY